MKEEEGLENGATGQRGGRSRRLCMWLVLDVYHSGLTRKFTASTVFLFKFMFPQSVFSLHLISLYSHITGQKFVTFFCDYKCELNQQF
jgi:hypothetical protein